jgi:hypothetical protein
MKQPATGPALRELASGPISLLSAHWRVPVDLVTRVAKAQTARRSLARVPNSHTQLEGVLCNSVCTSDAPNVIGPYSQADKGGGFIFVSGQLGLNPATQQIIGGDARQQNPSLRQRCASHYPSMNVIAAA